MTRPYLLNDAYKDALLEYGVLTTLESELREVKADSDIRRKVSVRRMQARELLVAELRRAG